MLQAVHDLPKRIDLFSKYDWDKHVSGAGGLQMLDTALCRDPLYWWDPGIGLHAVWGFDRSGGQVRVLLGDPIGTFAAEPCPYHDRRRRLQLFSMLAPTLATMSRDRPPLDKLLAFATSRLRAIATDTRLSDDLRVLDDGEFVLEWADGKDMVVAALIDRSSAWTRTNNGERPVDGFQKRFFAAVGHLYDYYHYRQQLLQYVPSRLFQCTESNIEHLLKVFSDPLAFDPRQNVPGDAFLWPWQRSIGFRVSEFGAGEAFYQPIPTTSLVLDIRASTTAMALSTEAAAFAQFIDDIVEKSRRIIVEHDGFFDKETGDGIVGHFCHATSESMPAGSDTHQPGSVTHKAIRAAAEIMKSVQARCAAYEACLIHGIGSFGPAIGIHTAPSVWLADGAQIRAIGNSVVGAARLCASATVNEIVISNYVCQRYKRDPAPTFANLFSKKSIRIKEFNEELGMFGYGLKIADAI
jgi:class 3 adenylate cyclase